MANYFIYPPTLSLPLFSEADGVEHVARKYKQVFWVKQKVDSNHYTKYDGGQ